MEVEGSSTRAAGASSTVHLRPRTRQPICLAKPPQVADDDDDEPEDDLLYLQGLAEWDGPADLAKRIALTLGFFMPAALLLNALHESELTVERDRAAIFEAIREDVAVREGYASSAQDYRARIGLDTEPHEEETNPPESAESLREKLQQYRKPWAQTLPWQQRL